MPELWGLARGRESSISGQFPEFRQTPVGAWAGFQGWQTSGIICSPALGWAQGPSGGLWGPAKGADVPQVPVGTQVWDKAGQEGVGDSNVTAAHGQEGLKCAEAAGAEPGSPGTEDPGIPIFPV